MCASHDNLHSFVLDLRDAEAVAETIERVERELGAIDYLVNIAGVLYTGGAIDVGDEDWMQSFAVNTHGVFFLTRAVARRMRERRRGGIVTVGSNAASTPRIGMAAYAASKAATAQHIRCLGLELAEYGIRCNLVSPGSTDTEMQRQCSAATGATAPATPNRSSGDLWKNTASASRCASWRNQKISPRRCYSCCPTPPDT
jgi:2,3-dihydro-2,3-dihydroxybenzoate dehydrogenase